MKRPEFKFFQFAENPRRAYSDAMKNYLVYLEENQKGSTYEALVQATAIAREEGRHISLENTELKKTLKILRAQIRQMFSEKHHGD